jgi:glycosyltransferase involved in cell wall biosynthesis
MRERKSRICLMSSIPVTLWSFYRSLPLRLSDEDIEVHICSSDGPELKMFRDNDGVKTWTVPISRKITPFRDLLSIFKLRGIFRRQRFDIVHAHTPKAGLLGMIAAKLAGVENRIYTCHGLPLETEKGFKRRLLTWAEKLSCYCATQVLVVSNSLLEQLEGYGICHKPRMEMLCDGTACGVDLERFSRTACLAKKSVDVRREYNIPDNALVIGFIGRLVPDKGIHLLVQSFCKLYCRYQNIRLLILGSFEPHRGVLPDETINHLNNHPGIIMVGFSNEIEPYYAVMDMLVLPTRREGFPYTLLEAAAMELPVVATEVTGCVDAVVDGKTGLLVVPENVDLLSRAIEKLIQSDQLRDRMGREARRRVEEKFTVERLLAAHVRLYHRLLRI